MTWMRRGDCPAVFSLEILRRIPCTGEESAPREIGRGIQQISKQTDVASRSRNTSAPRNGIFIQIPQGLARRGFKNQNPARGRKLSHASVSLFLEALFKNQNPARGRSVPPASPARAGEGDRVSGGGGAMDASCKPSIATEVHASHERPHRLACSPLPP